MNKVLNISIAIVLLVGGTALADWFPGEDHKMHYPQLPDPFGWDVKAGYDFNTGLQKVLADDWQCSESGPVTDVHLWGSWHQDLRGDIEGIHLSIHDDVPAGADPNPDVTWSHPGTLLWDRDFSATEIAIIDPYGTGIQGWYNPNPVPPIVIQDDHQTFHQINIENIDNPFIQEVGKIYWLDVTVFLAPGTSFEWGWKTSQDKFNDDAVWGDYNAVGGVDAWNELRDPITGESLDLAFVITPEPATMVILALGLVPVFLRKGRKA